MQVPNRQLIQYELSNILFLEWAEYARKNVKVLSQYFRDILSDIKRTPA